MITKDKGFTLIELLVVISIIGILAALATFSFSGAQKQARDTQRKSDLAQYRTILESYANKNNGFYLLYSTTINAADFCAIPGNPLGITGGCPEDPKFASDPTHSQYKYQSSSTATKYVLWAEIENVSGSYWIVCSSGQSGRVSTAPQITEGGCPI